MEGFTFVMSLSNHGLEFIHNGILLVVVWYSILQSFSHHNVINPK